MNSYKIRTVKKEDNPLLAKVLRDVLIEMGVPKVGTAYEDKDVDAMYEAYHQNRKIYYVVESNHKIIGGAGIAPLQEGDPNVCELQKMYFLPEARRKGIGSEMMKTCLQFAKKQGFTQCYLETMPYMIAARKLYKKTGFTDLSAAMGNTGHYSCKAWMLKNL